MLLSIITVNYNNADGLEKTIKSVLQQSFSEFEYIVIDGGSTDGSKGILERYSDKITYWVSEKDKGIYHAMNKGIDKAVGVYTQFLNSGDYLLDENSLKNIFANSPTEDIVYADFSDPETGNVYKMPQSLSFRFFYRQSLNHQACLIKNYLFKDFGKYDENIPLIADWDFFLRAIVKHNCTTRYIPQPLIYFDFKDSVSNKECNWDRMIQLRRQILSTNYPLLLADMQYLDRLEASTTYKVISKIAKVRTGLGL